MTLEQKELELAKQVADLFIERMKEDAEFDGMQLSDLDLDLDSFCDAIDDFNVFVARRIEKVLGQELVGPA